MTKPIDPNASPDALRKLANLILRGIQFKEIPVAEALRACAAAWDADRADMAPFAAQIAQRKTYTVTPDEFGQTP